MMPTDKAKRTDSVQARLNEEPFDPDFDLYPDAKGPDEGRLDDHANERRAWAARQRRGDEEELEDE